MAFPSEPLWNWTKRDSWFGYRWSSERSGAYFHDQLTFADGAGGENIWVLDDSAVSNGDEHIGASLEGYLDGIDSLCPSSLPPPGEAPEDNSNGSSLTIFVSLSVKGWRAELRLIPFDLGDDAVFEDLLTLDNAWPLFCLESRAFVFAPLMPPFLSSICSLLGTAIFLDEAGILKWECRMM